MEMFNQEDNKINDELLAAKHYLKDPFDYVKEKGIDILLKLAETGNPEAYYLLGEAYLNGNGVTINKEEAEAYLQEAAEEIPEARLLLGKIYMDKNGILWRKKAARLFKEAAEAKLPEAMFLYALSLLKNDRDSEEGIGLMYEAAEVGIDKASTYCGLREDSLGNFTESFRYYDRASQNDVLAKRLLADRYMYLDVPEEEKSKQLDEVNGNEEEYLYAIRRKSFNLYKKASEQGDLPAKFNQAIYQRDGIYKGTSPNMKIAIDTMMDAAEHLYYPAIRYLEELAESARWQKYFKAAYDRQRFKWLEEQFFCAEADLYFRQGKLKEAFSIYKAKSPKNTYAKIMTACCLLFGYGTDRNTHDAATALKEITSHSITGYNPLAHYLFSYYFRCVLYNETEKIPEKIRKKELIEAKQEEILEHAKYHYKTARKCILYAFKDEKKFMETVDALIPQCSLDFLLNEIDEDEEDGTELDVRDNLLTEDDRRERLLKFLQGLKGRMEYHLVTQDTFGRYAKGTREVNKEDVIRDIVFDAHLSLKECKHLYSLAKISFDPLKYADHKNMEIVLTEKYKSLLDKTTISNTGGLDDIYRIISKMFSESKLKKVAR